MAKPHVFPLDIPALAKIAQVRYHAKAEALTLFSHLATYNPNATAVESVQQSILLRKIAATVSEQLGSGKYDLTALHQYTTQAASLGAESLVQPIGEPGHLPQASVNYVTGIAALDQVVGSFHDELVVVSARPKNGKSNFFVNLVCLSPKKTFLYVTVADYGYVDLCQVIHDCDDKATKRKNIQIADFTSFPATTVDVETVVRKIKPDVVIVDRAEKLTPLQRAREQRWELTKIFETLRQLAKKYKVPVFVDAQQSDSGGQWTKESGEISPNTMAEDKTGRYAALDIFIGLSRKVSDKRVALSIHGRRKSLPQSVEVRTNPMGRYL